MRQPLNAEFNPLNIVNIRVLTVRVSVISTCICLSQYVCKWIHSFFSISMYSPTYKKHCVFYYLRMSLFFISTEDMEIHGVCHVAPSCLCSGPEQTLLTLAVKRNFFWGAGLWFLSCHCRGGWDEWHCIVCNLQPHCLNATKSYTLDLNE